MLPIVSVVDTDRIYREFSGSLTAKGEHRVKVSAEIVIMKNEGTQYFPTLSVTSAEDTEPPEERIAAFR